MIKTKLVNKEVETFDCFVCDRCKKEIGTDSMVDEFELQETHSIDFTGGYNSVFGDLCRIKCDLCQDCLKELIGSFCRYE